MSPEHHGFGNAFAVDEEDIPFVNEELIVSRFDSGVRVEETTQRWVRILNCDRWVRDLMPMTIKEATHLLLSYS